MLIRLWREGELFGRMGTLHGKGRLVNVTAGRSLQRQTGVRLSSQQRAELAEQLSDVVDPDDLPLRLVEHLEDALFRYQFEREKPKKDAAYHDGTILGQMLRRVKTSRRYRPWRLAAARGVDQLGDR
jgi:hypothetical protein